MSKGKTKKEAVFERLKAGEHFRDIKKEMGGGGSAYDGYRMYWEWVEPRVVELQSQLAGLERDVEEKERERVEVSKEVEEATGKREALEKELDAKRSELERLKMWLAEVRSELAEADTALTGLRAKGLTPEAIARIGRVDFGEGDELLERIGTVERHQELVTASKVIMDLKQQTIPEYQGMLSELKDLEEAVNSERNALDEVRRRRSLHEEANNVVEGFLLEGYDADMLLSLLEPLKALSVKGQPMTSLTRLVTGLNDYRLLKEIEDAIGARQTELSTLEGELQESQATLRAVKEHVLGEIEDAQNRSIEQMYKEASVAMKYIKSLRDLNKLSITELKDSSITSLRKVRETHEKELDQSKDALMGYIGQVSSTAQTEIQRVTQSLQATLIAYEKVIREWGEAKEESGEYKEYFPLARIIHDAIYMKENAGTVPLETMR